MKVCIVSDSHDRRDLLEAAVAAAKAQGAEAVLHCGDVVAAYTVLGLRAFGLPVHLIYGNNQGDLYTLLRVATQPGSLLRVHGPDAELTLAKRRLFLVHYPHYARGMALTGDYDVVCCGHDHRPAIIAIDTIRGTRAWLVNPGTVGGVGWDATYVLGDLATLSFEIHAVATANAHPALRAVS